MGHLTLMHGWIELPIDSKIVSSVFAEHIERRGKISENDVLDILNMSGTGSGGMKSTSLIENF